MLASLNPASPQSLQRLIFKMSPMISSISQQSLYMSRIELAGYVLTGTCHPGNLQIQIMLLQETCIYKITWRVWFGFQM